MNRIKTIKNVQLFLKLLLVLSCIQMAFVFFSYTYNLVDSTKFFGSFLDVETTYTLNNEQMMALEKSGYPGCKRRYYPNGNVARSIDGFGYNSKDKKFSWRYKDYNSGDCVPESIDYSYKVTSKSITGFLLFLFEIIKTLLVAGGIYFLLKILSNTITKHPFVKDNSRKLNWIAYSIFIYAFLDWIYRDIFMEVANALHSSTSEGWRISFNSENISFSLLLLGFLLLIISSIFKYGYELKTENDLTI